MQPLAYFCASAEATLEATTAATKAAKCKLAKAYSTIPEIEHYFSEDSLNTRTILFWLNIMRDTGLTQLELLLANLYNFTATYLLRLSFCFYFFPSG